MLRVIGDVHLLPDLKVVQRVAQRALFLQRFSVCRVLHHRMPGVPSSVSRSGMLIHFRDSSLCVRAFLLPHGAVSPNPAQPEDQERHPADGQQHGDDQKEKQILLHGFHAPHSSKSSSFRKSIVTHKPPPVQKAACSGKGKRKPLRMQRPSASGAACDSALSEAFHSAVFLFRTPLLPVPRTSSW